MSLQHSFALSASDWSMIRHLVVGRLKLLLKNLAHPELVQWRVEELDRQAAAEEAAAAARRAAAEEAAARAAAAAQHKAELQAEQIAAAAAKQQKVWKYYQQGIKHKTSLQWWLISAAVAAWFASKPCFKADICCRTVLEVTML